MIQAGIEGAIDSMTVANWLVLCASVISGAVAVIVARLTGRQNKQVAETTSRGPEWGLLVEGQREEIKLLREGRDRDEQRRRDEDERYEALEARLDKAERRAHRLARAVRDLKVRYVASVRHIKEWRIWSVTMSGPPPRLPDLLVHDVDEPPTIGPDEDDSGSDPEA